MFICLLKLMRIIRLVDLGEQNRPYCWFSTMLLPGDTVLVAERLQYIIFNNEKGADESFQLRKGLKYF